MVYSGAYWGDVDRVVQTIPEIEKLANCSVLITGATGMICFAVAELLFHLNRTAQAGIHIYLAGRDLKRMQKRFAPFQEDIDYNFVYFNATKDEPLSVSADYIIHGASNASPVMFRTQPVETMLSNLTGLNCLLSMAAETHAKRLLYVSSSEVYGRKNSSEPFQENDYGYVDVLSPRSAYPNAKRAAETLCVSYGVEYGVDTVIVRPGHIYGPSITDLDDRASAQFTRAAARSERIVMKSAGNQLRSYCYTLDCASAILTVLLNGKTGEAYNISNRDSVVTIRGFAQTLAHMAKTQIVFEAPSNAEKQGYNPMENSALVAEKLESLGWRPQFDLQAGIARTIEILRKSIEG